HRIIAAVAARIGYAQSEVTCYTCRHTYTAARLQTLDNGAPVSPFSVGRELGHGGDALVRKVYGHLGQTRHRAAAVEYRVEQHAALKYVPHRVGDSVKSNGNLGVLKVLRALGAGADIVSVGELRRALAAGFEAGAIVFSGVGKTAPELDEAIRAGVGYLNIESS